MKTESITNKLIDDYYAWLRSETKSKSVGGGFDEISTPFLDRHNDHIQIYIKTITESRFLLSDLGNTLDDLEMSGCNIDTPKNRQLIQVTLNGYGVKINKDNELYVEGTSSEFAQRKHFLVQAILAINDLAFTTKTSTKSSFNEDVANWMNLKNIRYADNISLLGKSNLNQRFDFLIPKSNKAPERLVKLMNTPSDNMSKLIIFSWLDVFQTRQNSEAVVIVNDENGVSSSITDAFHQYQMHQIAWSDRDKHVELLAA